MFRVAASSVSRSRTSWVPTEQRGEIVRAMFARHRVDSVSYWLQIVLATGIATLGLALNSTGVVIGAMLISPLMSPLVGLGMVIAVGAPLLGVDHFVESYTGPVRGARCTGQSRKMSFETCRP